MRYTWFKLYADFIEDSSIESLEEVMILSHIRSFELEGKCCFTSNSYLGFWLKKSENDIDQILENLKANKRISILESVSGNERMITLYKKGSEKYKGKDRGKVYGSKSVFNNDLYKNL